MKMPAAKPFAPVKIESYYDLVQAEQNDIIHLMDVWGSMGREYQDVFNRWCVGGSVTYWRMFDPDIEWGLADLSMFAHPLIGFAIGAYRGWAGNGYGAGQVEIPEQPVYYGSGDGALLKYFVGVLEKSMGLNEKMITLMYRDYARRDKMERIDRVHERETIKRLIMEEVEKIKEKVDKLGEYVKNIGDYEDINWASS
jgi:hypothetical protein